VFAERRRKRCKKSESEVKYKKIVLKILCVYIIDIEVKRLNDG